MKRAVTRIWEAILDNVGAAIAVALFGLVSALYAPLRSRLANWAVALWTWLLSFQVVALPGVLWFILGVALVLLVYRTVRGLVVKRRAAQPETLGQHADDRSKPEWVQTVGARLDDLILDLRPCFAVGSHTSIYEAFHSSSATKDDLWNQTHYVLVAIGAWFHEWDAMRQAVGTDRISKVLAQQLASLNVLLANLGFVTPDVSRRYKILPADDLAHVSFRPVADRYNHFLTEYEALLRRLPQEAVLNPPPLGKERVFIRL